MQLTCAFATAAHGTPQLALGIISRSNNYNWVCVLHIAAASQTYSAIFIPDFNILHISHRAHCKNMRTMHTMHNAYNAQCIHICSTHASRHAARHRTHVPHSTRSCTDQHIPRHGTTRTPGHTAPLRTRHSLSSRRRV